MTSIYAFRKLSNEYTVISMTLPESDDDAMQCTELCTIEGITYVSVPDKVILPEQPAGITVAPVELTDALIDQIKDASPHVELIRRRVAAAIAERYTLTDEIKLLRTAPSAEFEAYNAYAEDCRAWGRTQYVKLGLA